MNFSLARIVSVDEFRDLLLRSTLSARRPVEDLDCLRGMLDNSDLAVDVNFQKQGIGTELISLTQSMLGPHCKIILLSAPAAVDYYPHIGFELHSSAWILPRDRKLLA